MEKATIEVAFRLSPVNAWFIRGLADPFVTVDGHEARADWSSGAAVQVAPGRHEVRTYFRYRRTASALGSAECTVDVAAGDVRRVTARNGVMNQTPFRLAVA